MLALLCVIECFAPCFDRGLLLDAEQGALLPEAASKRLQRSHAVR
jgi:hypothetical protein